MSDSLQPHGRQHTRALCPSSTPETCPNSYPLIWPCQRTISSTSPLLLPPSILPSNRNCRWIFYQLSYQGNPSDSWPHWKMHFLRSQFFTSGGQSTGGSDSASVLPVNIQDWFSLGLTGLIFLLSKGLSRLFSNSTVQKRQFSDAQLSLWSNSLIHTWLLEKP